MNLHEYQAKKLLAKYGVNVPEGKHCSSLYEVEAEAESLFEAGAKAVVIKAQIHSGGRGKGRFQSGFEGGVHLCFSKKEVAEKAEAMLGQVLVTRQTGGGGQCVKTRLVSDAKRIIKEFYLAILWDRSSGNPVLIASCEGGMDIEEVAKEAPEKMIRLVLDPFRMMPFEARKVAVGLGMKGVKIAEAAKLIQGIYHTFMNCDASLVEINPLCLIEDSQTSKVSKRSQTSQTSENSQRSENWERSGNSKVENDHDDFEKRQQLCAVDAKISIDDNALYRQKEIAQMRDLDEESPLEIEAGKFDLNYIRLDGNIACLVNGAGLAMATMDLIKHCGGSPANFLDVGGGASLEQVSAAFRIILSDPNVKGILVNIFGGIMQCDVIAKGIVASAKETKLNLPLVVRLEGNKVELGKRILDESGLTIISGDSMANAAEKIVAEVAKSQ